jgi:Formate hydrogenlyase subunit 6/NADH:ubiquinone oxidoreductase 23 kD subunit (chain I)
MKRKVILSFPAEATERPLVYDLVKRFDIQVNILKASIDVGKSGRLFLEISADESRLNRGIAYLEGNYVTVSPVASKISYNKEKCINCGNCALACISQALSIGKPEWKLRFDPEKCILCKLCLKACPSQLFQIEFSE